MATITKPKRNRTMIEQCNECGTEGIDNQDTGMCYDCHSNEYDTLCPVCESVHDLHECESEYIAKVINKKLGVYKQDVFIKKIAFPDSFDISDEENLYPEEFEVCDLCAEKIEL